MKNIALNNDLSERCVVDSLALPWQPSPSPKVHRRLLERDGGEIARATSIVRYDAGARFESHLHELGEEILVLDGTLGDEFGSYGLIWQSVDDASVFISFTSNLAAHRDALNDLVSSPDELIVCQVAVTDDVARALMAKLTDDLQGRFQSVGLGMRGVEIVLMPGQQTLADELVANYGDAVYVTVCADEASCTVTPLPAA